MRTRRHVLYKVRTYPQDTHSLGAYPQCTHFKAVKRPHVGFLMVFSRWYCVIMVLARGIVYFIIIIEPHDPLFEEEIAYIKQRRSFGLSMFLVEHLMRARSSLDLNKANLLMD